MRHVASQNATQTQLYDLNNKFPFPVTGTAKTPRQVTDPNRGKLFTILEVHPEYQNLSFLKIFPLKFSLCGAASHFVTKAIKYVYGKVMHKLAAATGRLYYTYR